MSDNEQNKREKQEAVKQRVHETLPAYRCHKVVRAGKIRQVMVELPGGTRVDLQSMGITIIKAPDEQFAEIAKQGLDGYILCFAGGVRMPVTPEWVSKHAPAVGGYFVMYQDGYTSYSPAAAFEAGYTRVDDETKNEQTDEAAVGPAPTPEQTHRDMAAAAEALEAGRRGTASRPAYDIAGDPVAAAIDALRVTDPDEIATDVRRLRQKAASYLTQVFEHIDRRA